MDNRTLTIIRDLKNNLEDIIVKLNSYSPQSLHDDIIPLLEDLEMLEGGLKSKPKNDPLSTNPNFTDGMIVRGSTGTLEELMGVAAGMNGAAGPMSKDNTEPTLSKALQDLHELVIRLDERLGIEMRMLPQDCSPEKIENINQIKMLFTDLKVVSTWLFQKTYDIVELEADDKEEEDGV